MADFSTNDIVSLALTGYRLADLHREADEERLARAARGPRAPRSLRLGNYRFTITKEVTDVQCAV